MNHRGVVGKTLFNQSPVELFQVTYPNPAPGASEFLFAGNYLTLGDEHFELAIVLDYAS